MTTAWNGIPVDPDRSGWHWVAFGNWIEPKFWIAPKPTGASVGYWRGGSPGDPAPWLTAGVRYLGPCDLPKGQ
jgi:hypothetical protein